MLTSEHSTKKNFRRRNKQLEPLRIKVCSGCEKEKPFSEFHKHKARKHGLGNYCKECKSEIMKQRIRTDPVKYEKKSRVYSDRQRWKDVMRLYGLTREQYEEMERIQDNKCAICGEEETFAVKGKLMTEAKIRRLCVDHSHTDPPKVRGLLCTKCNRGLGYFNDDPVVLKKAATYLEHHQEGK